MGFRDQAKGQNSENRQSARVPTSSQSPVKQREPPQKQLESPQKNRESPQKNRESPQKD